MQEKFRVTNIARDEDTGNVVLRVISDNKPSDSCENIPPSLEDYYLYVFGDIVSV